MAGPFKIENKPYTMTIATKAIIAAIESGTTEAATETADAKVEPAIEPAPTDATSTVPMGEVETPTTVSGGRSWIVISIIVGLAVVVAGFAIYKKTVL